MRWSLALLLLTGCRTVSAPDDTSFFGDWDPEPNGYITVEDDVLVDGDSCVTVMPGTVDEPIRPESDGWRGLTFADVGTGIDAVAGVVDVARLTHRGGTTAIGPVAHPLWLRMCSRRVWSAWSTFKEPKSHSPTSRWPTMSESRGWLWEPCRCSDRSSATERRPRRPSGSSNAPPLPPKDVQRDGTTVTWTASPSPHVTTCGTATRAWALQRADQVAGESTLRTPDGECAVARREHVDTDFLICVELHDARDLIVGIPRIPVGSDVLDGVGE